MENNWAADHLQTIRTLMERSALYRRALAPVMILNGAIGLLAALASLGVPIESNRGFAAYWMTVGLVALAASFLRMRRQALKDAEPFWTPPTRRISQALLPAFLVGLLSGLAFLMFGPSFAPAMWVLALVWVFSYGCALHAAAFFVQRGIRLFAWTLVIGGGLTLIAVLGWDALRTPATAHRIMGALFGALHLAYGSYLYVTEKDGNPT